MKSWELAQRGASPGTVDRALRRAGSFQTCAPAPADGCDDGYLVITAEIRSRHHLFAALPEGMRWPKEVPRLRSGEPYYGQSFARMAWDMANRIGAYSQCPAATPREQLEACCKGPLSDTWPGWSYIGDVDYFARRVWEALGLSPESFGQAGYSPLRRAMPSMFPNPTTED